MILAATYQVIDETYVTPELSAGDERRITAIAWQTIELAGRYMELSTADRLPRSSDRGTVPVMTATTEYGLSAEAVALLQKTLDFITEHPERHRQGTWLAASTVDKFEEEDGVKVEPNLPNQCGTYGCVAGWLSISDISRVPEEAWIPIRAYNHATGRYDADEILGYDIDLSLFNPAYIAAEQLGIEHGTPAWYRLYDDLFDSDRELDEIWFVAQDLADGRLVPPDSVTPRDPSAYDEYDTCPCCSDDWDDEGF